MLPPPPTIAGRILIVDDDDSQRTALAAILSDRGFETQIASDGLEALERLNHPDAPTGDTSPSVSHDGTKLYFSSDRPGGKGGRDLWVIETRWFN